MNKGGNQLRPVRLGVSGRRLLLRMLRQPRLWIVFALAGVIVNLVPPPAGFPIAFASGLLLLTPIAQRVKNELEADDVRAFGDAYDGRLLRFEGFWLEHRAGRVRWRQVRCSIEGGVLEISLFWNRRKRISVPLRGATIVSETTSAPKFKMKPGQIQIFHIRAANNSALSLVVYKAMGGPVEDALRASSGGDDGS
mgnify:CR=1 FL=1